MAHFIIIFTPLFDDVYEIKIQMGLVVKKEEEIVCNILISEFWYTFFGL